MLLILFLKMASKSCKHFANAFCFVCGQFIKTRARKLSVQSSIRMCEAYKAYFGVPVGDYDKLWASVLSATTAKRP